MSPSPAADIRPVDTGRRVLVLALAGAALSGCAGLGGRKAVTVRVVPVETPPVLALLNGFRAGNGLAPLVRNTVLDAAAENQALAMGRADRMSHSLGFGDSLPRRAAAVGYEWETIAENLGMGYRTLEAAFAGWRGSPGHRANLLKTNATEFGIAHVWREESRYHDYWCLVLGAPDLRRA